MSHRRYIKAYFSIFRFIGASQETFQLNNKTKQMLGFIAVNSIEELIYSLIIEAYLEEAVVCAVDSDIDEMLDSLKSNRVGRFFDQTDEQIVEFLIQERAQEMTGEIEKDYEGIQGRLALRDFLADANCP